MRSLTQQHPAISAASLIASFVPPQRFAHVRFETYIPANNEPSQQSALNACRAFVTPSIKRSFLGKQTSTFSSKPGLYLDGGFGVGKTHLLASMWHFMQQSGHTPCAYASFVELTNAVGALGFQATVDAFSHYALICIDEFELDDPGDTVLMSSLLQALVDRGVRFAVTSNTLPDKLGEGRFAADDFVREIQGLRDHFDVIRVDGPDFRHVDTDQLLTSHTVDRNELDQLGTQADTQEIARHTFAELDAHLIKVHPSAYGDLVADLDLLLIDDVQPLTNQAHALRWVAFIDKLYDREIPVRSSGSGWESLFSQEMLDGGYRKKYLRALSRVQSLASSQIR